jgi:hypothetical protein
MADEKDTKTQERYEVRLMKIAGNEETVVESREVPLDKLQGQQQQISELPNREAMSLVNANIAAPINLAAALNVLSDNSVAIANAEQYAPITQGI